MVRSTGKQPTDGELEVLQILWNRGKCELGDICETIREERSVATTTIASVLKVMEDKGFVKRQKGRRGYLWSAVLRRESTARKFVDKQIERFFGGSAKHMVAHLIKGGKITSEELAELQQMVENYEDNNPPKKG